mmetsp:Transcript_31611/g.73735  ORF Transcript_31611/g.73735 Transcript_31611/m.73735 type:complete len:211 (+) Transcript_31611:1744-2376(+)
MGVQGYSGADRSQSFSSSILSSTSFSTRPTRKPISSKMDFKSSSGRILKYSPNASAKLSCSCSPMTDTNFWKCAALHSSTTSSKTPFMLFSSTPTVCKTFKRERRKLAQASTFCFVCVDSLPCSKRAHRHVRGNCCVLSSNLYKFFSMHRMNSTFFSAPTHANVFWKFGEKNSLNKFLCEDRPAALSATHEDSGSASSFVESDFSHDAAK